MPESASLKPELPNSEVESSHPSDIPMRSLPQPDTNTTMPPLNTNINSSKRTSRKKETENPKLHTGTSNDSTIEVIDALTPAQEKMRIKLAAMYASIGALWAGVDMYAGLVVVKHADERAEEVVRACRHSKVAWSWLERVINSSDVGTLIFGHGLMFYAIMVHSGRIKGNVDMLAPFGLAEFQVMAPPSEATNGHNGDFARNQ